MPVDFKLPDLGENIESGDIVSVLVKEGDEVQPNKRCSKSKPARPWSSCRRRTPARSPRSTSKKGRRSKSATRC